MKITDIIATPAAFSRPPVTLRRNLVSPTSIFPDEGSWFGPCSVVVVEVHTDAGLVGVGTAGGFSTACKTVIDTHLAPLLRDEDPFRIEYLWEKMHRATVRLGRKGVGMSAISTIDIALWDIKGKALGVPVYELIGGRTKEQVLVYASRLYAHEDLDALAAEAREFKRQGFRMLKQRFGFGPADGPAGMARNAALIRTVREAVGEDIVLAADAYMGWDVNYTVEMCRLLRDSHLSWIEEPLMPDDLEGYTYLAQKVEIPISCGEHEYTRWGFKELLDRRAVRIIQPDANRAGGISEMLKICAMASAYGIPVVPHSNEAHNLHVIVSQMICPFMEYFPNVEPDTGNEIFWKLFTGEPSAHDGYVVAPTRPGLGIEINRENLAALSLDVTRPPQPVSF
jgi:L-rhamnonate dehydratase